MKHAYPQELGPGYEFKEYGMSLRIPKDWTFGQFDEKSYYLKLDCDSASIFCPNIVIRFVPGENISMKEYARLFELASRNNFNSFESKGVSVEKFDELEVGVVDFELTE
ncbi:MAG TPA: hypothetical protein VF191_06515, partial [Cyclobacteriaceae bacterium]